MVCAVISVINNPVSMGERLKTHSSMDISWYLPTFKIFCLKKGEGAFIRAGAVNRNNMVSVNVPNHSVKSSCYENKNWNTWIYPIVHWNLNTVFTYCNFSVKQFWPSAADNPIWSWLVFSVGMIVSSITKHQSTATIKEDA